MVSIGLLALVCALTSGVFGFTVDAPPDWTWEKGSFFFFLLLATVSFVRSTMSRPSLLWEVLDDIQGQRFQHLRQGHQHRRRRQLRLPGAGRPRPENGWLHFGHRLRGGNRF